MRTRTGILWTIFVLGFLHQGIADSPITSTTAVDISNATTVSPTINSATTGTVEHTTTNLTTTNLSSSASAPMAPTTAGLVSTPPTTVHTTPPHTTTVISTDSVTTATHSTKFEEFTSTTSVPEKAISATPAITVSASTVFSSVIPASTNPSSMNPKTTNVAFLSSAHTDPLTVSKATTTLNLADTPAASTTAVNIPSAASTQPSSAPTSQDQFSTSQNPTSTIAFQPKTTGCIKTVQFQEEISLEKIQDPENADNPLVQLCKMLLGQLTGNCSLTGRKVNDKLTTFDTVSVAVNPSRAQKIWDKISSSKPEPTSVPHTLIAILSSCGALGFILVAFAVYCSCHHRSYRKNQQHLTEELQTVENGYHDNPTLEVMEVQPEMQEKKLALNGEFNDSWIVPIDNLAKEDIPDEEDTHL
ncbi:podocalyxin [Salminus brasiliensis]|uniref:podocalyxin n=1 Tax=Salminus brasiliensis TaxID=930266 RepID=UPI003B8346E8